MSLSRQVFRQLRPLFQMLEEPIGRSPAYMGFPRSALDDPFRFLSVMPNVDVVEEADQYIIEAEVPGMKKENLSVRIGEGGRSLMIEGKPTLRRRAQVAEKAEDSTVDSDTSHAAPEGRSTSISFAI